MVIAGREKDFQTYCTKGAGAVPFAKIKADFDSTYLAMPFPSEPVTYGDPDPKNRDSDKADKWRDVQDVCGRVSGIAEAATLIWKVRATKNTSTRPKSFY